MKENEEKPSKATYPFSGRLELAFDASLTSEAIIAILEIDALGAPLEVTFSFSEILARSIVGLDEQQIKQLKKRVASKFAMFLVNTLEDDFKKEN